MGRYVAGLLDGLAAVGRTSDVRLTLFSIRGRVPPPLPRGARPAPGRAPARLLRPLWSRSSWPPVELLTGRVDVFHGTNFVLPPTWRAASVVTIHDLAFLRFPDTVTGDVLQYRHLVPRAVSRAQRVVTVSQAVAEEIAAEYGLSPERLVVAPNGVDPTWFTPPQMTDPLRLERGIPDRYLLFIGNQEPRKGLGTLLESHAIARSRDADVPQLVVAGPAGWGDRWGGTPPDPRHVVLAGYLDETELRAVVGGSHAVCMPSLYEGFGLPVIEAMATGRPVLVSDTPALCEVAGGHATVVPVGDVEAWSEAIHGIVHAAPDPAAVAARRTHARQFTWRRSAEAHLRAYEAAALEAGRAHRRSP